MQSSLKTTVQYCVLFPFDKVLENGVGFTQGTYVFHIKTGEIMKFIAVAMMLIISAVAFEAAYEQQENRQIRKSSTRLIGQSGGGGGPIYTNQLLDFKVARTSATVLTVPAISNVNVGGTVNNYNISPTITVSAGTGAVRLYIDSGGVLTAGHNVTLSCSAGCSAVSGVSAFPDGSIPLWYWPATSGTWDTTGFTDFRAFISGSFGTGTGGGGGSGAFTIASGTVANTALTAAGTSQQISLASLTGLAGGTRYGTVCISETTQFASSTATALTVSMGRTSAPSEITGAVIPLMVSSGDANYWCVNPTPPILTGTYSLILSFTSGGGNLNTFTAGSITWDVSYYASTNR